MYQVWIKKANTSEPPFKCRKCIDGVKTAEWMLLQDESGGSLFYWPGGTRYRGGVILIWALYVELREPVVTMSRERRKQQPCKADSIDASHRGGQVRSSAEVAVMVMERMDLATMLKFNGQLEKGGTI